MSCRVTLLRARKHVEKKKCKNFSTPSKQIRLDLYSHPRDLRLNLDLNSRASRFDLDLDLRDSKLSAHPRDLKLNLYSHLEIRD
ncbi:hypothetical protein MHYP_G00159150 [Metynnis hypsauchen]